MTNFEILIFAALPCLFALGSYLLVRINEIDLAAKTRKNIRAKSPATASADHAEGATPSLEPPKQAQISNAELAQMIKSLESYERQKENSAARNNLGAWIVAGLTSVVQVAILTFYSHS